LVLLNVVVLSVLDKERIQSLNKRTTIAGANDHDGE